MIDPEAVLADPEGYDRVLRELERGLRVVSGLAIVRSETPGWIGIQCDSEAMALWLLRAIVVENVSVRREDKVLFPGWTEFPAREGDQDRYHRGGENHPLLAGTCQDFVGRSREMWPR